MRKLLLSLLVLAGCSKGPQADLPAIGAARSLGAEWALVNQEASRGHLTGVYVKTMRQQLREQLRANASSLTQPDSRYAARFRRSSPSRTMRRRKSFAPIPRSSSRLRTDLNPLELTLGIMTAVGGFVDISELVFAAQAGSIFGYALIWVFAFSTIGIMAFGEISGRVAAVARQPVFNLMRHRLGLKLGLLTLFASLVSTLITCAAEVGGMGLILHHLTGAPYLLMAVASTAALMASVWVLPFKWIERAFGLLGLLMIVFAAALIAILPPWDKLAGGFVPQVPKGLSVKELLQFSYFGVAILSAVMFPYEAYFYSSGGIEEEWGPKDLLTNRVTTTVGFGLGSLLAIAILASSAQLFGPVDVAPDIRDRRRWKRRFRSVT